MIRSFKNQGTEDVFNGVDSKAARKVVAEKATKLARFHLIMLEAANTLSDLKSPGNQVEKLKADRAGHRAIRINRHYRVCFTWTNNGAQQVEATDYH